MGARWGPFTSTLGPHDSLIGQPIARQFVPDGAGSVYGLLSMLLPGFSSFRYPSKLLTFMAVGLAVLAGLGWDHVAEGGAETRRLRQLGLAGLVVSLVGTIPRIGDWRPGRCLPAHAQSARPDVRPRGGRRRLDRNSAGLDTRRDRLLGFGCPAHGPCAPGAPLRWPSCSWWATLPWLTPGSSRPSPKPSSTHHPRRPA